MIAICPVCNQEYEKKGNLRYCSIACKKTYLLSIPLTCSKHGVLEREGIVSNGKDSRICKQCKFQKSKEWALANRAAANRRATLYYHRHKARLNEKTKLRRKAQKQAAQEAHRKLIANQIQEVVNDANRVYWTGESNGS